MGAVASPLVIWVERLIASDAVPWDVREAVDASNLEKGFDLGLSRCAHTFLIHFENGSVHVLVDITGDGTYEELGHRGRRTCRS